MEINFKQVTLAREYRGYTQSALAAKIKGLSQANLSKYEKGINTLSDNTLNELIEFLKFPKSFYSKNIFSDVKSAHYREKSGVSKKDRITIESSYKFIGYIVDQMALSLDFPEFKFEQIDIEDGYTPAEIAKSIRTKLKLEYDEPIRDINKILESNGIIVYELKAFDKFDGVSFFSQNGNPLIIINSEFSNDRKRFTLAHELGHIIMHTAFPIPSFRDKKVIEKEANSFASEFLMPQVAIENSLNNLKLSYLSDLSKYWLTSMYAILYRALNLGCIDKGRFIYLRTELSRVGGLKNSKNNVYIDNPRLFFNAFKMHTNELEYSIDVLADTFSLSLDILNKYCKGYYGSNGTKLRVVV